MNTRIMALPRNLIILVGMVALFALGSLFILSALFAKAQEAPPLDVAIHTGGHASTSQAGLGATLHAFVKVGTTSEASSTPTGSVEFLRFANTSCAGSSTSQTVNLSNAEAESATTTLAQSGLSYRLNYGGDGNYGAAQSSCISAEALYGRISVDKVTVPSGATTTFNFVGGGSAYEDFSLSDGSASNTQLLPPGNYSITEAAKSGWVRTSSNCSINGATSTSYTPGSTLALGDNDAIECVFTNTEATTTPPNDDDDDGDDDDDDDDGHHFFRNFLLPPGIFKKIFDEDFVLPPGIQKKFLDGGFFDNLFHKAFKKWDDGGDDDEDDDDDDGDDDDDDDDDDGRDLRGRTDRGKHKGQGND